MQDSGTWEPWLRSTERHIGWSQPHQPSPLVAFVLKTNQILCCPCVLTSCWFAKCKLIWLWLSAKIELVHIFNCSEHTVISWNTYKWREKENQIQDASLNPNTVNDNWRWKAKARKTDSGWCGGATFFLCQATQAIGYMRADCACCV